ncbi:dTDP-4-dehydrorhamnose 3,5-epimerase [Candidatus Latescibacterota bacterium]
MKIESSNILPEVKMILPDVYRDLRGSFYETYHAARYRDDGIDAVFVQDNLSCSERNVLRGLHYQLNHPQGKLVCVVGGEVFDVAVDIRLGSPTFGRWAGHVLSSENNLQLYIPPGFAHGFVVKSNKALFAYKCTDYYNKSSERGIRWDDSDVNISWDVDHPILLDRDRSFPSLSGIPPAELPVFGSETG